jgi:hypothetical protein
MASDRVPRMCDAWALLPRRWLHIDLPGYRELEGIHATYYGFPYDELPPIPLELDDNCDWLLSLAQPLDDGLPQSERELEPSLVRDYAFHASVKLPKSFERFMSIRDLQSRVRSCTDCYLDPGERIVATVGTIRGHLIHFLSDSQSCAHWYVHILSNGGTAVLESADYYGLRIENSGWIENPACRLEKIDLTTQDFVCCASSFSEFLYRFWIENEIWFASHEKTRRPMTELELRYVRHYETLKGKE